jgi:7-cyano-7-deazaguanine synthase
MFELLMSLKNRKKVVVVHSGGMDSSLCLAHAIREFGNEAVLSLSFSYAQRHSEELKRAKKICDEWKVDHQILPIDCLSEITENSLTRHSMQITHEKGKEPNSLVVGRNGLMARIAGIHANHLGAHLIYMGVIEVESASSGYRDCSRHYMDLKQEILRVDFADPHFEIRTPLVKMTKAETMEWGHQMGILPFLLENTLSCYEGQEREGCKKCPACQLRNEGIREFLKSHPDFQFSYRDLV